MKFKEILFNNPIIFLFTRQWKFSEGNRKNLVLAWIMFVFANIMDFFRPLVIAFVLNNIQNNGLDSTNIVSILLYLGLFVLLELGFWVFHGPARVMEIKNAFLVRANFKKYMVDGTMNLSASWHTDHHSGDTIDKIEKGSQAIFTFSSRSYEVIEVLVRFLGSYLALMYFNLHSAYLVFFIVLCAFTIIIKFDAYLIKQYKFIFGCENVLSAKVYDIISNITTVIILRIEKLVSKEIWKKIMLPYKVYSLNTKISETKWFLVSMCGAFMTATVIGSYVYVAYKSNNSVMLGTIFVLYTYVNRIADIFFHFAYRYSDIVKWRSQVWNSEEISNQFTDYKKIQSNLLSKPWNKLEIKNLNFSYDSNDKKLHLTNVNLEIFKGQRIALVGESGSGKTTTLKIIRELYPINSGEIYIDKYLLEKGFKEISANISLIPQEPEIFTTTIKENITVGVNYPMFEIQKFSKMACFEEVIERLPNKYDSSIVEKGVNLSGGEKQRLALTRGLMASKDKEIILLDEPTSSVDSKNELEIYQNIFSTFKKKTILSSIHKLHLLYLFDKIYYFKKGKIVASGTFDDLLQKSPEFKKLWEKYTRTHKEPLK
ncbi:MAG: ABC transporter ATP-binding protein [Candidatus Nanoarchaeia archaeon]|nr:ABC transporter ATP-binding protein [Candidatus Nanoarchaeia archaeon]